MIIENARVLIIALHNCSLPRNDPGLEGQEIQPTHSQPTQAHWI